MKKDLSVFLIVCYSLMIFAHTGAFQDQNEVMQITSILDNIISADKGALEGITVGDIFTVHRAVQDSTLICGKARVILVQPEKCALEIMELKDDLVLNESDILVKIVSGIDSTATPMNTLQVEKFSREKLQTDIDYYITGRDRAAADYNGSGTVACGLIAGFGLGLIGWGIGYVIVASSGIKVPARYTVDLNAQNKKEFDDGYTDQTKSKRKSNFNIGAAIGTLGAVILIVSLDNHK